MIRKLVSKDVDSVMLIWLEANLSAHSFVLPSYWHSKYSAVKQMISSADVYVYEKSGAVSAFVGIAEGYIEGLFVAEVMRSQGVGKALMDWCKEHNDIIKLSVYEKNSKAVKFYVREGFGIENVEIDAETGETEYLMKWQK